MSRKSRQMQIISLHLWISNIDDDRIEVRSKIEESLKKLIKETLVQKNGEIYIFLTNEEQGNQQCHQ